MPVLGLWVALMSMVRIELERDGERHCVELETPDMEALYGYDSGPLATAVAEMVDRAAEAIKRSAGVA